MTRTIGKQRIVGGNRTYLGRKIQSCVFIQFLFEPRDLWIGVYHSGFIDGSGGRSFKWGRHVYICLFPTLVVHLQVWWHGPWSRRWSRKQRN